MKYNTSNALEAVSVKGVDSVIDVGAVIVTGSVIALEFSIWQITHGLSNPAPGIAAFFPWHMAKRTYLSC